MLVFLKKSWNNIILFCAEVWKEFRGAFGPVWGAFALLAFTINPLFCLLVLLNKGILFFIGYLIISYMAIFIACAIIGGIRAAVGALLGNIAEDVGPGAAMATGLLLCMFVDVDGVDGIDGVDSIDGINGVDGADAGMSTPEPSDPSSANPPLEEVSGYTRSDGTEVDGYMRTEADGFEENNLNYPDGTRR